MWLNTDLQAALHFFLPSKKALNALYQAAKQSEPPESLIIQAILAGNITLAILNPRRILN